MEAYINGMSCISKYNTIDPGFFFEDTPAWLSEQSLTVTPADYKKYIPVAALRRTSQILKMGISAGLIALERAGVVSPDATIVGTAMGCFEDTDKFLRSLVDNEEKMLTPTSFIQSTHNTVAGQIALLTKAQGYNFTYVHQNLSFEYALLDAMMLLKEMPFQNILVGGIDEFNTSLNLLFEKAGHLKKNEHISGSVRNSDSEGFVAGQGAAFFVVCSAPDKNSLAKVRSVKNFTEIADEKELEDQVKIFLNEAGVSLENISVVLSGESGDVKTDQTIKKFFSNKKLNVFPFKDLCGEYFTASGFALWLGASIIHKQQLPAVWATQNAAEEIKNILIVNQYLNGHYSLMLLSEC